MAPSLSPLHHNIMVILNNTEYDESFSRSREVRTKMRILEQYITDDNQGSPCLYDIQSVISDKLGVPLHIILNMWPQIADGMVAGENDYD